VDALDHKHDQRVKMVNCAMNKSKTLTLMGSSAVNLKDHIEWALRKGELMQEVFNVNLSIQRANNSGSR
jgi:hypothetical protein